MVTAKILTLADVLLNICIRNILKNYQRIKEEKGKQGVYTSLKLLKRLYRVPVDHDIYHGDRYNINI